MSGSISHEKAMTESATQAATEIHRIRIWDLPTRLFHWLLAICIVALVVTAKMGGNAMNWHLLLGQVVLAICAAVIFISTAFVIKLTQPIEYRR